jgi:hypothetical protein
MLALAAHSKMLRHNGLLFVALPSASLLNSRYCDVDLFVHLCRVLGFSLIEKKTSLKLRKIFLVVADDCSVFFSFPLRSPFELSTL